MNQPEFQGFPKMGRLSRECVITEKLELMPVAFDPYFVCGPKESKEEKDLDRRAEESGGLTPSKVENRKQGKEQRGRSGLPSSEIRERRSMERGRPEGCRTQGVDDQTQIRAMFRLRRGLPRVLHGLRPPPWREESLQRRQHVRPPLQPRTHSNRSGQMRFGLLQLPQNTNP